MKLSKSSLAVILSKLKTFDTQKVSIEQYSTDSEIAADIIWQAYINGDITNKAILDLGAGTEILGLGTMFFNPSITSFVDVDKDAITLLKENLKYIKVNYCIDSKNEIINDNIENIKLLADTVIMNPPFGTKIKHNDTVFLKKAFECANVIYSLHKSETKEYLIEFAKKNGFIVSSTTDYSYPIKASLAFHTKKVKKINVSLFRFSRR